MAIFHGSTKKEVLDIVVDRFNEGCAGCFGYKHFVVTKSVGEIDNYKIRPLSEDPKAKAKRLAELKCTEAEYKTKALPAHAQLAEKMRRRGMRVDPGQRLEYLVTTTGGPLAKLFEKIEDPNYQQEYSDIIKIDYLYYIHSGAKQLDEILGLQFGPQYSKFTLSQYKFRVIKWYMLRELEEMVRVSVVFDDNADPTYL